MLYYTYSRIKTREELIKLIDIISTNSTSYQILNYNMNGNAAFNHQENFCTQLASCVIVCLRENMLDVCLLKEEMHDNGFFLHN